MNLLKMTGKVCDVAGLDIPTTLTGLDYYQTRCMNWVIDSWVEIQSECCSLWSFLRGRTDVNLIVNKDNYTVAEINITNFAWFMTGNARLFDGSEFIGDLTRVSRDEMSRLQETKPDTKTPSYWTDLDNYALSVYPKPDKAYIVKMDHYQKPVYLVAETDIPNISDEHHQAIVDLATHKYSISDNNPELEAQSKNDHDSKMNRMNLAYCPQIETSRGKQETRIQSSKFYSN